MSPEKYFDRIEHFLSGKMSKEERNSFEEERQNNPALQAELDLFQMSQEAIELDIENDLRQQMKTWQGEEASAAPAPALKVFSMRRRLMSFAAAACVLLLLGTMVIRYSAGNYSSESLATAYYENPDISKFRSGATSTDNVFAQGLAAFEKENYDEAAQGLIQVQPTDSNYPQARFLLAHSLRNSAKYADAAGLFKRVISEGDTRFVEKAEWGLVLTYLVGGDEGGNVEQALRPILEDTGHSFHTQANHLQTNLNSIWRNFTR